jgi:hypothetical protein
MRKLIILIILCICHSTYAQSPFDVLYRLAGGTWQMKTSKGYTCESWKVAGNNQLNGIGFKVSGADTVIQEHVKLMKTTAGIFYIPTVTDQNKGKEVQFKLSSTANGAFVFSNPQHDFPQRVVYQFVSNDSLHAWIEGQYNGRLVKRDFYYKRVK